MQVTSLEQVKPSSPYPLQLTRLKSDLILLLVAMVWGSAFVAQRVAANGLGVFLYNGFRYLLAALVVLPWVHFRPVIARKMWPWVLLAGLFLFGGSALQQAGLRSTTAGNAGFISSLYVVLVPLILAIGWRQHQGWNTWLAALLAAVGLLFLSTGGELRLAPGDTLVLLGAFLWACHVITVGYVVQRMDVLHFAIGQFVACGVMNLVVGLTSEWHTLGGLAQYGWSVAYVGIFSVALGQTLQALGQRHSPPADASIILSAESAFAALFGFIFLGETFGPSQWLGAGLILVAMILAQLNNLRQRRSPQEETG